MPPITIRFVPIRFFPPIPKSRWMREQIEARAIVQVLRAVKAWDGQVAEVDGNKFVAAQAAWADAVLSVERFFEG